MLVFLDFEASSLADRSYPIEVAWVFEDGRSETHLIRPAPRWTDWDPRAEAIHRIPRAELERDGEPHEAVAQRMLDVLSGHDLLVSAPSWDGKWLSALLRAAGLPRHALRLRDTEAAQRETVERILAPVCQEAGVDLADVAREIMTLLELRDREAPAHRALPDAEDERQRWMMVRDAALERAARLTRPPA